MNPKEFDVVKLKNGREVTILEVMGNGKDFYVEYPLPDKDDCDWFTVPLSQIEKITWRSK